MTLRTRVAQADAWLFGEEAAGRVRATRIGLAALIAVRIALGPYRGLADQPEALFQPVWYLRAFDHMPSVEVILALQLVGTAAAILAVLGWRERGALAVAVTSLLLLAGMRASRGKVLHNDVLLVLVAIVFVFAPVGLRLLDRRRSVRFGWPVRTGLVLVALAYFFTGFQKVVTSGPAWILSDNLRNVMYRAVLTNKAPTDSVALLIADHPALAHLAAATTLTIELGFVTILFWPKVRPLFVFLALALHGTIYLTHGLDYSMWAGVVVVMLVDWSAVAVRVHDRFPATAGLSAQRRLARS
jgi:hypothetical protein